MGVRERWQVAREEKVWKSEMTEGDWDRIREGGGVRDGDWAWHQMKHERGGGEAGNQYILINSQSSLCKSWKIQSRLENGGSRLTPAAAMFSLLYHYLHSDAQTQSSLTSTHTQLIQFFSPISLDQIAFLCTWDSRGRANCCHSFRVVSSS